MYWSIDEICIMYFNKISNKVCFYASSWQQVINGPGNALARLDTKPLPEPSLIQLIDAYMHHPASLH